MSSNRHKKTAQELIDIAPPRPGGGGGGPGRLFAQGELVLEHSRKDLWNWLFSFLKSYKSQLILLLLLISTATITSAVQPYLVQLIIDEGISTLNIQYVINLSIIYVVLTFINIVFNYYGLFQLTKISQKIVFSIRNEIFSKLQKCSMQHFDKRPSGEIVSICTNDVDQLNQLVGGQVAQIVTGFVSIIFYTIFMYIINPFLATLSLVIFPVYLLIIRYIRKTAIGAFRDTQKSIAKVTVSIQENISGAKTIQAYGQEEKEKKDFDEANFANYAARLRIRQIFATIFPLIATISSIITVSILLVGSLVNLGSINLTFLGVSVTPGQLVAFVSFLGLFFRPFMSLMQVQEISQAALASSDRIYSLLEENVEISDPKDPKQFDDTVLGKIQFDNVDFGYIMEEVIPEEEISVFEIEKSELKRLKKFLKKYPEPYKSFLLDNIQLFPEKLRQAIMKNLMITKPEEVPQKFDLILGQNKIAVPNSNYAILHPDYKTSFKITKKSKEKPSQSVPDEQEYNMEQTLALVENLEKFVLNQSTPKSRGGNGQTNMMGSKKSPVSTTKLARKLAKIDIPAEIFDSFSKLAKDAIKEEKKLIEHEETIGFVLKNTNLDLKPGNTLAIVGETGSGKTTLVKLISRFYDIQDGQILLDEINIQDVKKRDLRNLLGLVPQDAFLFNGTIKENLLYAIDDLTPEIEEKMLEVSKFLGLHNFIKALPAKYETKLLENGSNISIGQRQLIAFARALITDPKILILDEATSSVDPYTETLIQDALNKAREGRTTIIIAHRLSTIKNADHIIVLDKEKKGIIEEGNHDSLMSLNGKYRKLLDMQHREINI